MHTERPYNRTNISIMIPYVYVKLLLLPIHKYIMYNMILYKYNHSVSLLFLLFFFLFSVLYLQIVVVQVDPVLNIMKNSNSSSIGNHMLSSLIGQRVALRRRENVWEVTEKNECRVYTQRM
jgi:hypothetical protein